MKRTKKWSLPFLVEHKRTPQLEFVHGIYQFSRKVNKRTLNNDHQLGGDFAFEFQSIVQTRYQCLDSVEVGFMDFASCCQKQTLKLLMITVITDFVKNL